MPPSSSATTWSVLRGKPLIVGGGVQGVVSTACYLARKSGVRSAMPMFQARKLCPQANVIKPRMQVYAGVARQVRTMMQALTPLVEPLSLDEAYLDLGGTERMHGMTPAKTMARLALAIEREIGITVSIGLSGNKFLAKLASELDKPRGFAVIGMAEAKSFLRDKPVGMIRGAGKVLQARLERDGLGVIGKLQDADPRDLAARYGATGLWLSRMANAQDSRPVDPGGEMKTVSRRKRPSIPTCHGWPTWRRCCGGRPSGCRPAPRPRAWPDVPWCSSSRPPASSCAPAAPRWMPRRNWRIAFSGWRAPP